MPKPSSPPVHLCGFLKARIEPACANASVTIANAIPPTRSETAPSTSGSTRPTSAVNASDGKKPQCHLRDRDARDVDADREVERVPERQQPREAEEQVVGEREAAEDEAEREQLQRARAC